MIGKARKKTRAEGQTEPVFSQDAWGGGQNSDLPASKIGANELALLTNVIDRGKYIEGHDGSIRLSSTALPGTGTVYSYDFHPTAKKWLLHRGSQLWVADATITAWTEVKSIGQVGATGVTIAGDVGAHFSGNYYMHGANSANTNAGVTYWNFTNSAGTRTLSIYKNLAKTQLVAQGTTTGSNPIYASQQNNSGLQFASEQAYTGDDTDAGNTFTTSYLESSFTSGQSTIRRYKNDFLIFKLLVSTNSAYGAVTYVNLSDGKFYSLGSQAGMGFPYQKIPSSGSQSSATPYGRRYLHTYSRIVDSNGAADYTKNRVSGTLLFEGPSTDATLFGDSSPTIDYGEFWSASPVSASAPNILSFVQSTPDLITRGRRDYYTHLSLYATLDIGSAGIDPSTGLGNNREIYTWVADIDVTASSYTDTADDDQLRGRMKRFGLKTRFWQPLPSGACGCIVNDFLFIASRGDGKVYYQQLLRPENMGFHRPDAQFMTFDDGVQILAESQDQVAVICSRQTWKINPKINSNIDQLASVFIISSKFPASRTIGVTDWGTFQPTESGGFIARCSDGSVRIWNGEAWGDDLGQDRVRKTLLNMIDGSASAFSKNAFYIWYRTSSGDTFNTKCLRLGLGGDAGFGWSVIARSTWIFPNLRAGGVVMLDGTNLARLMVLDSATGNFYWIETFTNAESSFTKAWKDKENVSGGTDIACSIRLREFTGTRENRNLQHGESHAYLRPAVPADGYLSGFQVGLSIYVNGGATAAASASNAPRDGDIQLSKPAEGRRLQPEITTTTSKFRLTGYDSDIVEQDKATIGAQFSETDEAAYQLALTASMKHWLTRPKNLLNRATGTNYSLTGTAPTNVTGPDGRTYGLSFPSGSTYIQTDLNVYTDFTFSFWVKSFTVGSRVFSFSGNNFFVSFTNNTTISINGTTFTVGTIASGWHGFVLTRTGSTVSIYQNGVLLGTVTYGTSIGGGAFRINSDNDAMQLYEIRVFTSVLSAAAIAYYYDDVVNNAGKRLLPLA